MRKGAPWAPAAARGSAAVAAAVVVVVVVRGAAPWGPARGPVRLTIILVNNQCCESGSGIRCLFDPWIRDPGWVESQHPDPGSGMNNPDLIFESLETIILDFLGLKYVNSLMRIRDPGWRQFGSGMEKSRGQRTFRCHQPKHV
jgi:hypothetical protein